MSEKIIENMIIFWGREDEKELEEEDENHIDPIELLRASSRSVPSVPKAPHEWWSLFSQCAQSRVLYAVLAHGTAALWPCCTLRSVHFVIPSLSR